MKKFYSAILMATTAAVLPVSAGNVVTETDTSRVVNLEEVYIVASPKQSTQLRKQSLSSTIMSREDLQTLHVDNIKGISVAAPNFFMPDYGSRYTSAVYIRGIGSRMNTPAVGLYVDNVAYVDKSGYDFSFADVERVDVLRGPQSTLYGRNTMGGLVRIFTADPMRNSGTFLTSGSTFRNGGSRASFTTFLHPSDKLGVSLGAYYEGAEGFFRNTLTGKHVDHSDAGGAKVRAVYRATDDLKFDFTASYEQSYEGACPYYYEGAAKGDEAYPDYVGLITQNRPSTYRRAMLNAGLNVEWRTDKFKFNSVTAYQHLQDRMFIDQDFVAADIFSLDQRQRLGTFSQEFSLTTKPGSVWQSTTGAYAMMQTNRTTCPVVFYQEGVNFLNSMFAGVLPEGMPMSLALTDADLPFVADMRTPTANAAVFHQSTFKTGDGWSVAAGLRLDYDFQRLKLNSGVAHPVNFAFAMMGRPTPFESIPAKVETIDNDTWQLLPKFSVQYDFEQNLGNVYATVSKGYRSGGYNVQAYSDMAQSMLRRDMMQQVYDYSKGMMLGMGMPEAVVDRNLSSLKDNIPGEASAQSLFYKPEQTWSYELGGHFNFCEGAFQLDLSAFMMNTKDQQVADFAGSGMGRNVKNSGKSRSFGGEMGMRTRWMDNRLALNLNYGYTHATFRSNDNFVPYVPQHTFSAVADFRQPLSNDFVRAITVGANFSGAGKIMWNEENTSEQGFYGLLGAHLMFELFDDMTIDLWGKNLTQKDYDTFRFVSMNRNYAQRGEPCHFGIDLRMKF